MEMKYLLTGGGTGGHIYPALAVAKEIHYNDPTAEILYIGTSRGLESKIVPEKNIPFKTINVSGMPRKINKEMLKFSSNFAKGCWQSRKIIKDFKPDVVLGTGGYVCGPIIFMSWLQGVPTAIHEQNVVPGITNKYLARLADKTLVSFEASKKYFPKYKSISVTGNPRASEINWVDTTEAADFFGLEKDKKTLLVVSGSQGAELINNTFMEILEKLLKITWAQTIYVTGERYYHKAKEKMTSENNQIKIYPYLKEMQLALSLADLVVSRAGATTIAEITAFGIPSILIPSPNVTNDHQRKNANNLVKNNGAIMIEEKDLGPKLLFEKIHDLLKDDNRLTKMKANSLSHGYPKAAHQVVKILKKISNSSEKD